MLNKAGKSTDLVGSYRPLILTSQTFGKGPSRHTEQMGRTRQQKKHLKYLQFFCVQFYFPLTKCFSSTILDNKSSKILEKPLFYQINNKLIKRIKPGLIKVLQFYFKLCISFDILFLNWKIGKVTTWHITSKPKDLVESYRTLKSVYPKWHFVFWINWNMKLEIKFWFSFLYWSWDRKHQNKWFFDFQNNWTLKFKFEVCFSFFILIWKTKNQIYLNKYLMKLVTIPLTQS